MEGWEGRRGLEPLVTTPFRAAWRLQARLGNLGPLLCRQWNGFPWPTCLWPLIGSGLVTSPIPLCCLAWTPPPDALVLTAPAETPTLFPQTGPSWLQASHPPARWKHQPDVGTVARGGVEGSGCQGKPGVQAGPGRAQTCTGGGRHGVAGRQRGDTRPAPLPSLQWGD